jgi:hypothetical protein
MKAVPASGFPARLEVLRRSRLHRDGRYGTLTASLPPFSLVRTDSIGDAVTGFGDLYPQASLKWNLGVNNFMIYITGDIPVGNYSSTSLANLGRGHGAIDAGGGYTYFNPATGHEFSAVAGFTDNFKNPTTQYQSGVDFHLDWGASQFLSKQFFIGLVGYAYDQISADSGSGDRVGAFKSRSVPNRNTFFLLLESRASWV